jgi:hypothetical protein
LAISIPIAVPSPGDVPVTIVERLNQINFFASFVPNVCTVNLPSRQQLQEVDAVWQRPLLVIIRHGKTEHNQLGLFTGWEDAMLAVQGRSEAMQAGKTLRMHGIEVINFHRCHFSYYSLECYFSLM